MKTPALPFSITTRSIRMLADLQTPVGLYRKVRERHQESVLLESTDFESSKDNHSYIGFDPLASIALYQEKVVCTYPEEQRTAALPAHPLKNTGISLGQDLMQNFLQNIHVRPTSELDPAPGLFGYCRFEAAVHLDPQLSELAPPPRCPGEENIPLIHFTLYRFVIEVNHSQNTLTLTEHIPEGATSRLHEVEAWLDAAVTPGSMFQTTGPEVPFLSDEDYFSLRDQAPDQDIASIRRVLARRFEQPFRGDDFQVYRTLRSMAPSSYLFFFDFGLYRIMGSSPEPLLSIRNGKARISLLAAQTPRSGDDAQDRQKLQQSLQEHPHRGKHHEWSVNRAMEQLGRYATNVRIDGYCDVRQHARNTQLVSRLSGDIEDASTGLALLGEVFPAENITGIPKKEALNLIARSEPHARGFFGGAIGYLGIQGDVVLAVHRRSFLCNQNLLSNMTFPDIFQEQKLIEDPVAQEYKLTLQQAVKQAESLNP